MVIVGAGGGTTGAAGGAAGGAACAGAGEMVGAGCGRNGGGEMQTSCGDTICSVVIGVLSGSEVGDAVEMQVRGDS